MLVRWVCLYLVGENTASCLFGWFKSACIPSGIFREEEVTPLTDRIRDRVAVAVHGHWLMVVDSARYTLTRPVLLPRPVATSDRHPVWVRPPAAP
jgi:hypothetical protein